MDQQRYSTLSAAAEVAATRCGQWQFATAVDEVYDRFSLIGVAEIHDGEADVDEESFYVVSPKGAIGFSESGETIDWLFLPLGSTEELPPTVGGQESANYCSQCGSPLEPGARFCGSCGTKL